MLETLILVSLPKLLLEFKVVGILLFGSLAGRTVLIAMGQRWVATFAHTATLCLLPIITYFITKLISGNIALSLGMVGALSIVRFRNPVKSPFELSIYFAAITMGIAASISTKWLLTFLAAVLFALVVLVLVNSLSRRILKKNFFNRSFSEGNRVSTLAVVSKEALSVLRDDSSLVSENKTNGHYSYVLSSENSKSLQELFSNLENDEKIIEIRFNNS